MIRLTAVVGAVAASVAVAVSAFGTATTPTNAVAEAAQVTARQPGAQVTMTQTVSVGTARQPVTVTGSGFVDPRDGSGELTLDLSRIPGLSTLPAPATETVLFRSGVVYLNIPFLTSVLPPGKTWIEVNVDQAAKAAGLNLSRLSPTSGDPSQYLKYLYAGASVKKVGDATVDGESTTHYQETIELSKVLSRFSGSTRSTLAAALHQITGGRDSLPVQVWVDPQHRVRREQLALHFRPAKASPVSLGTLTIDFKSFGTTREVRLPPASEVIDVTTLASAGLASKNG
jgi:hypothetical protein